MEHKTEQEITDIVNAMNTVDKAAKKLVWQDMSVDEAKKNYMALCLRKSELLIDQVTNKIKYDTPFCAGNTDMPATTNLWKNASGDLYLKDRQNLPEGESMMTLIIKSGDTISSIKSRLLTKLTDLATELNKLDNIGVDIDGDGYKVIKEVLNQP